MSKRTQILLDSAIHYLRLTIGLRMVRRSHSEQGATVLKQLCPAAAYKNRITTRNNTTRNPMVLANHRDEEIHNLISCKSGRKRSQVNPL
ncbi:hypothetical protein A2U01_0065093 [Trifolium medium]|uniref:Uncharacterized protein n=1 Tax=Trifolium medium TaxID=97028 RepID=A0A392S7J1_9FABA|nr:hypothetical protein [Trifolium medium]